MQQVAFSFSHALQKGQEALGNISLGMLLIYFYHLVVSYSSDEKNAESHELVFLLITLKSFFLVHLFSTLHPLGLSVIKERGGADEWHSTRDC